MQARGAKAVDFADWLVTHYGKVIKEHLQGRGNLAREDLEYLMEKTAAMRDERLKRCIAELVAWGDNERAEVETFCAIALEVMRNTPPSRLRSAAMTVELKTLMASAGAEKGNV